MGTVWLGSLRLKGCEMRVHRGVLATALAAFLTSCIDAPPPLSDAQAAHAEIVAEGDARGESGLDRVHGHLESADPAVRAMAVRALGRLEDPGRITLLGGMFDDPDAVVRAAAAMAMAQAVFGRDPGDALPTLAAQVERESDPAVLGALATNLGRLAFGSSAQREDAGEAIEAVARRLEGLGDDAGLAARLGLARGIEAFARGGATDGSLSAELVAAATELSTAASTAADQLAAARVRRLATAALIHTDQLAPDHAAALLQDEDWGLRRQVMIRAARDGTGAAAMIRTSLGDPDPHVRAEALRAYDEWMREAEGCAAILAALDDPDPDVVAIALELLAKPCTEAEAQRQVLATRVRELDEQGETGARRRGRFSPSRGSRRIRRAKRFGGSRGTATRS